MMIVTPIEERDCLPGVGRGCGIAEGPMPDVEVAKDEHRLLLALHLVTYRLQQCYQHTHRAVRFHVHHGKQKGNRLCDAHLKEGCHIAITIESTRQSTTWGLWVGHSHNA